MKIDELIEQIELFAPPALAAEWDNSGWQVKLLNAEITKVMLALTITNDVVNQAADKGCNLVLSHHPLMFSKINRFDISDPYHLPIINAIQHNIQVYSAHTNLDRTNGGLADYLAKLFEMQNTVEFKDFVKIGELKQSKPLLAMVEHIKKVLNADKLKLINPSGLDEVKKIALCPGGGAEYATQLEDVDLYITGDVKYHSATEIKNLAVIDAGHYETERIYLPEFKKMIEGHGFEVLIAEEPHPWDVV